ncbi:hypothetical protein F5Y18DRAFT_426340 [Xylariaceae sp. FL1019]|nr:hypothetical protein F5Y18DRAFT_426340 [Xylariaceae sp. FL1019]
MYGNCVKMDRITVPFALLARTIHLSLLLPAVSSNVFGKRVATCKFTQGRTCY